MRKVVLFIAMSLDGYIADKNGGVEWLHGQGDDSESIDTYSEFIKNIDTVLMGWNTYHQITTELSPNEWVYDGLTTYVFTHHQVKSAKDIIMTDKDPVNLVKELKEKTGKDIWICGGANLIHQLMTKKLIDEYQISIIPTLLGKGIELFGELDKEQKLKLIKTQNYNGIVEKIYKNR